MLDLANQHDAPIPDSTWDSIRREAAQLPPHLTPEASRNFLSLLAHPGQLGRFVRELHDMGLLELFLPDFARAADCCNSTSITSTPSMSIASAGLSSRKGS